MFPFPSDNFRDRSALARFFLVAVLGFALDLWTKYYAFNQLAIYNGVPSVVDDPDGGRWISSRVHEFIPGYLHFTVTTNHGAVFGWGEGKRLLFVAVSVAAIGFLTWLFATSGRQRFYQLILGMLLAGVLGNLYDRLKYGYVRDMIHALPQWPDLFPWIFNIADVLLCTGVGLMILYSFFQSRQADDADGLVPAEDRSAA